MRALLFLATCAAAFQLNPATAQTWPSRPLTMVVAFPAGGADDALGRLLAARLTEVLGQPVTVENVGGRGGMTGASRVAKAASDGYEFLLGSSATHALSQSLYKAPLYNSLTDFEPVRLLVEQPMVLLARKTLDASDLNGFVAHLKSSGNVQYGSAGVGSATHIACARLNAAIGSNAKHAPYAGGGPAMRDLIAGKIDYFCPVITIAIPQVRKQTVKAIATLGAERSATLPDVPSAGEQGLSGFTATTWFALFLPKDTPAPIVKALSVAAGATLDSASVREKLRQIGAAAVGPDRGSPAYLREFLQSEISKYGTAVTSAGIRLD